MTYGLGPCPVRIILMPVLTKDVTVRVLAHNLTKEINILVLRLWCKLPGNHSTMMRRLSKELVMPESKSSGLLGLVDQLGGRDLE